MSKTIEALASFLKMLKRVDSGGVVIDAEFKETIDRALKVVDDTGRAPHEEGVGRIPATVISALLSSFYMKKNRVVGTALSILHKLIQYSRISYDTLIILYRSQRGKQAMSSGEALFCAIGDFISYTTDSMFQMKCVEVLYSLVSDDNFTSFTGNCIVRCVRVCCQITLHSSHEATRTAARDLLLFSVLRVTRAFIETTPPELKPDTFSTCTLLDDYIHDVEPDSCFTAIEIKGNPTSTCMDNDALNSSYGHNMPLDPMKLNTSEEVLSSSYGLFQPHDYLQSSATDFMLASGTASTFSAFHRSSKLPQTLKDILLLVKHICKLASRTCSGSGSTSEKNPEVRVRQLALDVLEVIFMEIPLANCDSEHPCAAWLSVVISVTKYDILRCIARNLSTIIPSSFFTTSIRILTLLLRKCHYHLPRELHALLAVMLFPLMLSKFSSFSQKYAVLSMVRELVSVPHLCVSFFINYDCNPFFDPAEKYGGMLELLVDFIVGMTYADFLDANWLSLDQQQLLRGECASATHSLVGSMHRWVLEDPREYMRRQVRETVGQLMRKSADHQGANKWREVYFRSGWETGGQEEGEASTSELLSDNLSFSASSSFSSLSLPSSLMSSSTFPHVLGKRKKKQNKNKNNEDEEEDGEGEVELYTKGKPPATVGYHWKHIHCLLQNKRILREAAQYINKGQWREGMKFLQQREYISSTDDNEEHGEEEEKERAWTEFARFLKTYPGIERSAVCLIFERVLKDSDCDRILREYLRLFPYKGVSIDVAFRDTTCKFMSWERPSFEAQVWSVIQERFGEAYGAQNPRSITPKDANAMAGVLLFLHTSLHNESMRGNRMTMEEFVQNGNACLEFPFPEQDMRDMYQRVAQQKWALDEMQRTPQQVEFERRSSAMISSRINQHPVASLSSSGMDTTVNNDVVSPCSGTNVPGVSKGISKSVDEEVPQLLETVVLPYTTDPEGFKLRESYHQRYVDVATQHLRQLESEHRLQRLEACAMQPYIVPHYAQHVRPMLLMLYPRIAAIVYMGFRVLEEEPVFRLLLGTYEMLYDVAAAFVVNLSGLRVAVEHKIQRCLEEENAQQLLPPIRGTFTLPLMNLL